MSEHLKCCLVLIHISIMLHFDNLNGYKNVIYTITSFKCICSLYDIIIFGSTFDTTLSNLRAIFFHIKATKLKPSKLNFLSAPWLFSIRNLF